MADAPDTSKDHPDHLLDDRDLLRHFESLGGAVRGAEFGHFLHNAGVDALGLLSWADLAPKLLIDALEQRLEAVGDPETTIIFRPSHSSEWWTRDTRFWMAMRTHIQARSESPDEVAPTILERLRSLRDRLLADLREGRKLFVFRDLVHDLDAERLDRLHAAIRSYGPGTLFYLRYEDAAHPAGLVEAVKPGLLIGYVAHFSFSRQNQYIGPIDDVLLSLCRRAWALHRTQSTPAEPPPRGARPEADPPPAPEPAQPPVPPLAPPIRGARPTSRQIVFVGNIQAEAMANLYRRYVAPRLLDRVEHSPALEESTHERRAALEQADLIVEQVMDLTPADETGAVAAGIARVPLPLVSGAFLWPFRAQAHAKAVSHPLPPGGTFDAETSDSYLNRLILAGADPEEAVEEYINLDLAKAANLDRLYGLMIDRQRARDAATGYDIAPIIERHFKTDYIFLTPYHPNTRIALAMAENLFRRLGATNDDIERMHTETRVSPFPARETPIHPGVCRHWGLSYIAPDQRYRLRNEESLTFREYALRYMRYESKPSPEEGLRPSGQGRHPEAVAPSRTGFTATSGDLAERQDDTVAIPARRPAEEQSRPAKKRARPPHRDVPHDAEEQPQPAGEGAASTGDTQRHGPLPADLQQALKAAVLAPDNAEAYCNLGCLLRQAGDVVAAEQALRRAQALRPTHAHYHHELSVLYLGSGRQPEALEAAEAAIAREPTNLARCLYLADVLASGRSFDRAREVLGAALARTPDPLPFRIMISDLFAQDGQVEEALTSARAITRDLPDNARALGHLAHVEQLTGRLQDAEMHLRSALALEPHNERLRQQLERLMQRAAA